MEQLEKTLNEWFGQKAPQLPMGIKNFLATIAPYLTIIGVLLGGVAILAIIGFGGLGFGLGMMSGDLMGAGSFGIQVIISLVLMIAVLILEAMAIKGLFKRTAQAWRYIFYAQLISIVDSLIGGSVVGAIISALIGFYILFQLRPLYMGGASVSASTPPAHSNPTPTETPAV